ncbi:MAG: DUF3892 domain-containing protein [Acutalibacteraceae bacterium]|nr:DUF3892 domain-containing protein [Acutalibacteraceae bacterium]
MNGNSLIKNTLDSIPKANENAKRIVGLVKENGRVTGYKLSDETFVQKEEAVQMAKQGQISGVGIAHRGNNQYLKAVPNGQENDNLGNLPSFSPENYTN